jgi:UDP-2,4-diacetamido-2,4,6-trideoxy-beta-L-altropyranose hydrolase
MDKKLKILIRTSGGRAPKKQLGLGHVYRSLNLSSHLKHSQIHFLIEDYGGLKQIFETKNIKNIKYLKKNIDINLDLSKTISYIHEKKIDLIIIDKYDMKSEYSKKLRDYVKVVVISDLRKINYNADLVINGFIGFENKIIKNKFGTKCILGPSVQILNKKFSKKISSTPKKYDLLITMGGFDEKNIIEFLLKPLTKFVDQLKIKIILGPSSKKTSKISKWQKSYGKFVKIMDNSNNMFKEMSNVKYGICSGGITSYEFAMLNIPFAIICQVKHQLITAKEWEKKRSGINFGLAEKISEKQIEEFLEEIVMNKRKKTIKKNSLSNQKGIKLITQEILSLVKK